MLEQLLLGYAVYTLSYNYFYYSNNLTDIRNSYDSVKKKIAKLERIVAKVEFTKIRYLSVRNSVILLFLLILLHYCTDLVEYRVVLAIYGLVLTASLAFRYVLELLDNLSKNLNFYRDTIVIHLLTLLDDNFKAELRQRYLADRETVLMNLNAEIEALNQSVTRSELAICLSSKYVKALDMAITRLRRIQLCKVSLLRYKRHLVTSSRLSQPPLSFESKLYNRDLLHTMASSLALTSKSLNRLVSDRSIGNRNPSDLSVSFESEAHHLPEVCPCLTRVKREIASLGQIDAAASGEIDFLRATAGGKF